MCGFCGEIHFDGRNASVATIEAMSLKMAKRGPDGSGIVSHGPVGLGHRRLSIIDLSAKGQQPIYDPELGLSLAFNGCIYNYRELMSELQALGYSFFSNSDTEVILKAYAAWGLSCVDRFMGMFAFAIHERDSGRTIIARDRLGIKPLYISETGNGKILRFASSLHALAGLDGVDTSIDPVALHFYMTFHAVVPPPYTILKGVRKFPPATISVFEKDGQRKDKLYWSPSFTRNVEDAALPASAWEEQVHDKLRTAVKRRMVADVPVGVLLSGGLDSSLVVGLLAEAGQAALKTFSIGFESIGGEEGDEFRYSDLIAKHYGTEHHKILIDSKRLISTMPDVIEAMSEPMVSHDNVGFYLLSEEVAKHVKVVQSGQGADEVFGGYHWYPPLINSRDPVADYSKVFFDRDHDEYAQAVSPHLVEQDYSRSYVTDHFGLNGAETGVDKALRLDSQIMLADDPVKRVDNMTMAWGLEARVPFLDHELVELAARIPPDHKLKGDGKGILKDIGRRIIPSEVINRPKGYFPVPALKYIEGPVLDMVQDALYARAAKERGLFNENYVRDLLKSPKDHMTPLRGSKLWQVALLEMWLQKHHY